MIELFRQHKLFFIIIGTVAAGFLIWYFSSIFIFIIVAWVISIIGTPLVKQLNKLRIGRLRIPHTVSVIIALLAMLLICFGIFSLIIPLVLNEAELISNIDGKKLMAHFQKDIAGLQKLLVRYGIMPRGKTLEIAAKEAVMKIIDFGMFSNILSSVISFTGNFFFNLFSIVFLSFFFLKDNQMVPRFIMIITPVKYWIKVRSVMEQSQVLLSRYFLGLLIQILLNIISYTIALYLAGVDNALIIGFFTGVIIIIPYIGGIISMLTGVILGVTGVIALGEYSLILPVTIKILVAMLIVQTIDNNVFAPLIQGKSVKAHPVEIFLVVIAAASVGGILGMIVAVPAYGFVKIVAGEFLNTFSMKRRMVENR